MKHLLLIAFTAMAFFSQAQVGINILIPDSSAVLQLESNKKGLGLSRLTSAQRDSIKAPLKGLTIFNVQDSVVEYWNGECWLKAYQKNCYECRFNMTINDPADTLDRVQADSVFSTIIINQTNGQQDISLVYIASPPPGVQISFNGNTTIDSAGTVDIVVKADIFAQAGNVPIIIQAFCGDEVKFITYNVYIEPCVKVTIPTDAIDYNLQAMNSAQLPVNALKCVVLTINNGVVLHADTPTTAAYTSGQLNPQSIVAIVNNGAVLGRGGDGGFGGTFNGFPPGNAGERGGDALNLTTRTILVNNGSIFGGGSGGGSVGVSFGFSVPIVGQITLGVGLGGGGGSELGLGGQSPQGGFNIGFFVNGTNATGGVNSIPGLGGLFTAPISIPISIATINIIPSGGGGDGGDFGKQGDPGFIDLALQACVAIPIIGTTCINVPIPGGLLPAYGPVSGPPGLAVKRNGNPLTGLPDGAYFSTQVKGTVAP
jgi:hypothetical protein